MGNYKEAYTHTFQLSDTYFESFNISNELSGKLIKGLYSALFDLGSMPSFDASKGEQAIFNQLLDLVKADKRRIYEYSETRANAAKKRWNETEAAQTSSAEDPQPSQESKDILKKEIEILFFSRGYNVIRELERFYDFYNGRRVSLSKAQDWKAQEMNPRFEAQNKQALLRVIYSQLGKMQADKSVMLSIVDFDSKSVEGEKIFVYRYRKNENFIATMDKLKRSKLYMEHLKNNFNAKEVSYIEDK